MRRVRVPSQASDVDQFLDDLFMPVLNSQLDELSDARSLAASIKGGGYTAGPQLLQEEDDLDDSIALARYKQCWLSLFFIGIGNVLQMLVFTYFSLLMNEKFYLQHFSGLL